ncbi:MAG: tetratricopeptide repeat protein [Verrucomicrobiota bacterium]
MSPTYVDFVPPQSYTQSSLMEELRTRLTPEELALIVNPLVSTPEIDRWARQVTAGATNDETRARMLFDLLALRARDEIVGTNVVFAMRTAQEAFAAWNRPTQALTCKDFAFLYVVMARAVGITAYDVEVEEEAEGPQAAHSCAAIILGKRRLLVDPTFNWFGVPHKKFIVLNDLQAAAVYVGQLANPKCPEIARKLAPELPIIQMNYFEHLVNFGRLNEARDVLQNLKRLDIITAGAREYADGNLALGEGRAEYAVGLLLKAVAMNPYDSNWRITLARACVEAGDVTNAVDNFREALHSPIISSDAEFTQFALAHTNELARLGLFSRAGKLLKEGDWTSALKFYDKEIRLWPDDADAYYYRAYARQAKGDTNGASEDYNNAIRLKPELRSSAAARASQ